MPAPDAHIEPNRTVELTINSCPQSLAVVRAAVCGMAGLTGFSEMDCNKISLAIDEALTNVIKHGYHGRPDQPIHLRLESLRSADGRAGMRINIRDLGDQVDPATIRGRDLAEVRPGGLGVHIMRTVMDDVEFSCPVDGGMLLRMAKFLVPVESDGHGNRPAGSAESP